MKSNEMLRRKLLCNISLFILGFLLFSIQSAQGRAKTGSLSQYPGPAEDEPISSPYQIESDFPSDFPGDKIISYVSDRESVPLEELKIINVVKKSFENLSKEYWIVKVEDLNNYVIYSASLDTSNDTFVDDYQELERAEKEAYFAKYGVLKKTLYDRMQSIKDEDKLPVGIWIIAEPKYSEEEVYASLAEKYPEAQESLVESAHPFNINNRELLSQIENEYTSMITEGIQPQLQPIIDLLSERGFSDSARSFL